MAENGKSENFTPRHLDLVEACKNGDQKAQFELYRLYHTAMYNTTLRIVGDSDDAEDVMQEAFLKAFSKLDSYRGEVSFGAWLKRIVINKALDFLRLKKEQLSLEDAGEIGEIEDKPDESPEVNYRAEDHQKSDLSATGGIPDRTFAHPAGRLRPRRGIRHTEYHQCHVEDTVPQGEKEIDRTVKNN